MSDQQQKQQLLVENNLRILKNEEFEETPMVIKTEPISNENISRQSIVNNELTNNTNHNNTSLNKTPVQVKSNKNNSVETSGGSGKIVVKSQNSVESSGGNASITKKRKASANSESSTTPVVMNLNQPPLAKQRKMTQQNQQNPQINNNHDFKRHNSLIDDTCLLNNTNHQLDVALKLSNANKNIVGASGGDQKIVDSATKKMKLKTSLSSVDLTTVTGLPSTSTIGKSSENTLKKSTVRYANLCFSFSFFTNFSIKNEY